MKLATFVERGKERFGIIVNHPASGTDWIFDPEETEQRLEQYTSGGSTGYRVNRPHFLQVRPWPRDLKTFLALGEPGMTAALRLLDFLQRFLEQSDQFLMIGAGFPLNEVRLRAPIPRPRLYYGMVGNSPSFVRHAPSWVSLNLYPKGHQRPQGTVIGPGEPLVLPRNGLPWGFNVELGVIIGQGGRYIPVDQAMQHVAGFTVVTDACGNNYTCQIQAGPGKADFMDGATESWGGKKCDTMCPMGPYLVTRDEIGNVYDLLVYTRQSGWLRDRSHTAGSLLGVERLIHWFSSFATLYPGDVLHCATMGVDGLSCDEDVRFGPNDYIESEIERVGVLRNPVVIPDHEGGDWRPADDVGRAVHPAPAVRDSFVEDASELPESDAWRIEDARHLWTLYGNYTDVEKVEGASVGKYPRFLNGPNSALSRSPAEVEVPPRARAVHAGAELAFIVRKVACRVPESEADEYILGYVPLASFCDLSFKDEIKQILDDHDWGMPKVYGRWADGFCVVAETPIPLSAAQLKGREMVLRIEGFGQALGNTDEYVHLAAQTLAFITQGITLFPGDVVTLGRVAKQVIIASDQTIPPGTCGEATVEGVGRVEFVLKDRSRSRQQQEVESQV